jgi:hypothetical protein
MEPQFRITLWPDIPLKVPAVQRADRVRSDEQGWVHASGPWTFEPLAEGVVLGELLEVDVRDPESLVGFVAEQGVFTRPPGDLLGQGLDTKGKRPKGCLHVNELNIYVRYAQALTRHWLAAVDGERVMTAWEQADIAEPGRRVRDEVEDDIAGGWFVGAMNAGLEGVPPHVMSWGRLPGSGERLDYGEPHVDLYTGLTVQLFNLILDDLPIRTCANERCERMFTRQRGRAVYGNYRTVGVRFCSNSCAKAQAQREYRRRNKKGRR